MNIDFKKSVLSIIIIITSIIASTLVITLNQHDTITADDFNKKNLDDYDNGTLFYVKDEVRAVEESYVTGSWFDIYAWDIETDGGFIFSKETSTKKPPYNNGDDVILELEIDHSDDDHININRVDSEIYVVTFHNWNLVMLFTEIIAILIILSFFWYPDKFKNFWKHNPGVAVILLSLTITVYITYIGAYFLDFVYLIFGSMVLAPQLYFFNKMMTSAGWDYISNYRRSIAMFMIIISLYILYIGVLSQDSSCTSCFSFIGILLIVSGLVIYSKSYHPFNSWFRNPMSYRYFCPDCKVQLVFTPEAGRYYCPKCNRKY